jgi:hypothetical protein
MAGLGALHIAARAKLSEITNFLHVNTWNNQFAYLDEGGNYAFAFPCAFIEIVAPEIWQQLLGGYKQGDVDIKIHIGQVLYDDQQGNFEQNLDIYTLRDLVHAKFSLWKPATGGPVTLVDEAQDYDHTNVYHYVITLRTGFIDDTGSLDANAGYITKDPPTDLSVEPVTINGHEPNEP